MLYSYVYHLFSLETHALTDTSFPFKSLLGTYYPFFIPYNPSISEWPWVSWVWVQIFHTVHPVGLQYSIGINVSHRFYIIISTKTLTSVRHCTYKDVICLDVFSSVDGLSCCMQLTSCMMVCTLPTCSKGNCTTAPDTSECGTGISCIPVLREARIFKLN